MNNKELVTKGYALIKDTSPGFNKYVTPILNKFASKIKDNNTFVYLIEQGEAKGFIELMKDTYANSYQNYFPDATKNIKLFGTINYNKDPKIKKISIIMSLNLLSLDNMKFIVKENEFSLASFAEVRITNNENIEKVYQYRFTNIEFTDDNNAKINVSTHEEDIDRNKYNEIVLMDQSSVEYEKEYEKYLEKREATKKSFSSSKEIKFATEKGFEV